MLTVHQAFDLLNQRRLAEAGVALQALRAVQPTNPAVVHGLAMLASLSHQPVEAIALAEESMRLCTKAPPAWHANLGVLYRQVGRLTEAVQQYQDALNGDPQNAAFHNNLANTLAAMGANEEAARHYELAMSAAPDDADFSSNYLLSLNYLESMAPEAIAAAHRAWGTRFTSSVLQKHQGSWAAVPPLRARTGDQALRIGYVSADLKRHSVAQFLGPLIEAQQRRGLEVYLYCVNAHHDDWTERLQASAKVFRPVASLSTEALAARIREDALDVLVDLAGHTKDNRLSVFALRTAPLQVTWLGYPNTTGLPAMDARIVDAITDPPGPADALQTERVVRMAGSFLCFRGPLDGKSPDVVPGPLSRPSANSVGLGAAVTFGCFNAAGKLSPSCVSLWAKLLDRIPRSRLILKSLALTDAWVKLRFSAQFAQAGVDPSRIELRGYSPTAAEHLAQYGDIDVALDPFPYNGTTTTCEALWMGVPVLALRGDRHVARVSASVLTAVGLSDWVAEDPAQYLERAQHAAAQPQELAQLRNTLRARLLNSELANADTFAVRFEAALNSFR